MTGDGGNGLFRTPAKEGHHRVTFVELFFDLVFVFAVTQLSHKLQHDFSARGVLETGLLLLAVWWVWIYTSWITNWLDPDRPLVRLMLFAMMLGGLGLSTSIPKSFGEHGLVFASCYAAMQVGRTAFMRATISRRDMALARNFNRVLVWLTLSAMLWIWGGLQQGSPRMLIWSAALAFEYLGPAVRFWTPGLGASSVSDWSIEGGHLAERCALFIIIALGESVLMIGATFAQSDWTTPTLAAFGTAFLGTLAMWWIYFDKGAELGAERIARASEPGRLARLAYTYLHLPIVGGIILSAFADELVLTHPTGHSEPTTVISTLGGPLEYLIGVLLFKRAVRRRWQLSHMAGVAALLVLAPFGPQLSPLALAAASSGVLAVVAVWESISLAKPKHTAAD